MKVLCEREKLLPAFQLVASAAPEHSGHPILRNVKLDAGEQGVVTLTWFDSDVGIRMEVSDCTIESPGEVLLPIDDFSAILAASTDERIGIESDGKKTIVQGVHSEFRLPSENPDGVRSLEVVDDQPCHEVSARLFRELIRRTVFATDNESSRYALGGVLLEMTANGITGVATDGRRLAVQEGPARSSGWDVSGETTIAKPIVPTRAMQLLKRALAAGLKCGNIQLAVTADDVRIKSGRFPVYARLLKGTFPIWRDIFPQADVVAKIHITAGPLCEAVRQAAIVDSEEAPGVLFNFGDGQLVLPAGGHDQRRSRVELPIAHYGPKISIRLDPRYVADFLKVLEPQQTFVLELRDAETPAVFSTDDGYRYLLMPRAKG